MEIGNSSIDNQTRPYPFVDSKPVHLEFVAGETLSETELRIQHAQRLENIGGLTAGVAHDFNNLLTAIMGNAGLAMTRVAPGSPIERHLQEIETASKLASELTRQLLTYSRQQKTEVSVINVNKTIYSFLKLLERVVGKNIRISLSFLDTAAFVKANKAQIEQVLINLCVNARDAMPKGGDIFIETSIVEANAAFCHRHQSVEPGFYSQIKVTDNGTGMDQSTMKRIFEPFFTTKEIGQGTGIGLSLVASIIKENSGHITVESEIGKGTTFNILLPIIESGRG